MSLTRSLVQQEVLWHLINPRPMNMGLPLKSYMISKTSTMMRLTLFILVTLNCVDALLSGVHFAVEEALPFLSLLPLYTKECTLLDKKSSFSFSSTGMQPVLLLKIETHFIWVPKVLKIFVSNQNGGLTMTLSKAMQFLQHTVCTKQDYK